MTPTVNMRLVGWWLIPISWAAIAVVDWLVYGNPLAWSVRASTASPIEAYLVMIQNPTVGAVVGAVLVAPLVLRLHRVRPY